MKLLDVSLSLHTVKPKAGDRFKLFGFDAGRLPDGRRFVRLGPLVIAGSPAGPPPGKIRMVFDVPEDCAPVLDALRGKPAGFSVGCVVPRPPDDDDTAEPETVH